jgi:phage-related protein
MSPTDLVSRSGMAFLPGTIYEMSFRGGLVEQHTKLFLSDPTVACLDVTQQAISDRTLGWQFSRIVPENLRQISGKTLFLGYHIANDAFNLGAYYGSKVWDGITQGIKNGADAVGSFINEGILALQKKAQDAKKAADEALKKVNEVRQFAQEKIEQAKVAYQTFKQETQKRVAEVVQVSQQKIQQVAQKAAQAIQNAAPKVAQAVTKFVKGAVQVVSNVINAGKQILTNVINTGKQVIENVFNTGKQVVSAVTNFVKDTYNSGIKLVSETAKTVQNAVSNTANNVAKGFNKFKSAFGF